LGTLSPPAIKKAWKSIFFFCGLADEPDAGGGAPLGLEVVEVTREEDLAGFLVGSTGTDPKTGGPSRCNRVGGLAGDDDRTEESSALAGISASEPNEM
jgi:hypothetical protein